jgi:uncharacterized protein (DUF1800 family)
MVFMPDSHEACIDGNEVGTSYTFDPARPPSAIPTGALIAAAGLALSACGGGSEDGGSGGTPPINATPPTAVQASRFLAQASMGATKAEIGRVQAIGYSAWIDEQISMASSGTRWDWLMAGGYDVIANQFNSSGADACQWVKLISSPDTLRQRVTLALSEILVTSLNGFSGGWEAFTGAAYLDLLQKHAFGNYRTLLQDVTLSAAMGEYLTYRNNRKLNPNTGALPDENYAREVMQLFTIGLTQLNLDGSPKLSAGLPQDTYTLDDITGLARVFTGWNYDLTGTVNTVPEFKRRPMILTADRHENGAKTFLGSTIPAGTTGAASLSAALDTIFAHPNVGPFIGRQLIQRLVCSNPSPDYIARVATVFNNDGAGVKGNLRAVIKAILLDDEARSATRAADPAFGKLREPVLRFTGWARAFKASSPTNLWNVGNTSEGSNRLGQSPLRSGSVFNFFRPGYVPPNSAIAGAKMVAPEFQITNESSVVGYVNYMQNAISRGVGEVKADYSSLIPLAETAQALLDEINLVLAAGQLSAPTLALIVPAIDGMAKGTDAARLNRIYAALVMVMAAPEFLVQK